MIETMISDQIVLVDDEDKELLSRYAWYYNKSSGLCARDNNRDSIIFTRLVMNCPDNMVVDHISRNNWDCRRSNLRLSTRSENQQNRGKQKTTAGVKCSSIYKGVSWVRDRQNWRATITVHRSSIALGIFYDEIEAAHAYNEAAKKYFKDFAVLNMKDGKVL